MMVSEAFHFLRPWWLLAIPVFWLLGWWYQRSLARGGVWKEWVDPGLLPYVVEEAPGAGQRTRMGLLGLATMLALVAVAGPTWQRIPVPVFRNESALVIVLDLSASMNAADIQPTRLEMAKFKIADLLKLRKSGQNALVVFAAQGFVVTPLTDDTTTLLGHLQGLDTSIMPSQGSEPATALKLSANLLTQAGVVAGHILLITDGADEQALTRARAMLADADYSLSVMGIGTAQGAPIPDRSGGFAKYPDGEIILSSLAVDQLSALAASGGGLYLGLTTDDSEIRRLEQHLAGQLADRGHQLDDLASSQWREFGPWLLLALLPLAACGFRRGLLMSLLLFVLPFHSEPASAAWWETDDQAAAKAFAGGDFESAAEKFRDQDWRGAASYKAGDFEAAIERFAAANAPREHYNRGNALARAGRYEEAIRAYDDALDGAPEHADAMFNKQLLEQLLKDQAPTESEQDQSGDEQSDDEQDASEENSSDAGQSSGGQQGQQSDQQASDGSSSGQSEQQNEQQADGGGDEQSSDSDADQAQADALDGEDDQKSSKDEQTLQALSESEAERAQATEQWLRQIPDDPSGLLRRKFQYQYKKHYGNAPYEGNRW